MLSDRFTIASAGHPSEDFCSAWPADPACSIAPPPQPVLWPGLLFGCIGGALVTLICVALGDAWQRNRLELEWHDRRLIEEVLKLRNGILAELPWPPAAPLANAVPHVAGPVESAAGAGGAHAEPGYGALNFQRGAEVGNHQSEPGRELLDSVDQAVVARMAKGGHSLNYVCRELGISKGSSPTYAKVRQAYFDAVPHKKRS